MRGDVAEKEEKQGGKGTRRTRLSVKRLLVIVCVCVAVVPVVGEQAMA